MTVKDSLMAIKDFRVDRCKKHNLIDILMIVFFGLLCGYKSIEEIHFYAELSIDVLKRYLELPNGIPSSDTILRVLARIETKVLENVFAEYAKSTFKSRLEKDDVIAIDAMGMVRSWRLNKKTGEESYENRYFITSLRTVEKAAYALRSHWSIENNLHVVSHIEIRGWHSFEDLLYVTNLHFRMQ